MEFLDIASLQKHPGLRLVVVKGVPSPWSQAAKAMIEYKGLTYAAGLQIPRGDNPELVAWAGCNSGPVVAWNDEPPLNNWLDILNLIERLEPRRPLLPEDRAERALAIGLSNEICGERGLGWNRRISLYRSAMENAEPPAGVVHIATKYRYGDPDEAARLPIEGLELLRRQLEQQRAQGSSYLVGSKLSAVDFYWAAFSVIFKVPAAELVPMDADRRPMFEQIESSVENALSPQLIAHREQILGDHFRLPMEF